MTWGQETPLGDGDVDSVLEECAERALPDPPPEVEALTADDPTGIARLITWLESHPDPDGEEVGQVRAALSSRRERPPAPVWGHRRMLPPQATGLSKSQPALCSTGS